MFKKLFLMSCLISTPLYQAIADTNNPTTSDAEQAYLVQIMNQLDAVQPLILAAKQTQLPNKRIQFHYSHYQDSQGKEQNGLLEDVQAIKSGIRQYLNQPAIEPRSVEPLQGDYLNTKPVPQDIANIVSSTTNSSEASNLNSAEVSHADE